jgi:hypothetical protein
VHSDTDWREAGNFLELGDDPESEPDGEPWVVAAEHQRIADRLHLLGLVLGKESPDLLVELEGDLRAPVVATSLRQGREADEVGEDEGVDVQRHRINSHTG